MNLLLDTHTLLWWHTSDPSLSKTARAALIDPDNTVYLSAASVWEIQIKTQLGKLPLPLTVPELIQEETLNNGFIPLPVSFDHVYALSTLADHHKDPFDRLLIAQARHEGLTLVSDDGQVQKYSVPILW
ncbi:MAG: type II toxin-antitoxin system VapC family toxin [Pseudomonadota bacterium]